MGRHSQGRGEIIKEGDRQTPWLTLSLHYIYIVTLARNVIELWQVRESVPLQESFGTSYDTEGWVEVCALGRHVKTGCGDVT